MDDFSGDPEYDAAQANWGGHWRMPTYDEFIELINECTWTWTTYCDTVGYIITGSNGNSIFMPEAGYRYGSVLKSDGVCGYTWSSTPYAAGGDVEAYCLRFFSSDYYVKNYPRHYGRSIRAIYDEDFEYQEDSNVAQTLTEAPEQLYMAGLNENWDFEHMLYPTSDNEWVFESVFGVSSCEWGYKLLYEENNWDDYFSSPTGQDDGTIALSADYNIPFDNTGVFIWSVDCENLTYEYTEVTSVSYINEGLTFTAMTQDSSKPWVFSADITLATVNLPTFGNFLLNDSWDYIVLGQDGSLTWSEFYYDSETTLSTGTYTVTIDFVNMTFAYELVEEEEEEEEEDNSSTTTTTGTINGYEYVDLGLTSGLKWATINIGATLPADYGNYFAWGETSTKSSYNTSNSTTFNVEDIEDFSGDKNYDAATANWSSTWRMPTSDEYDGLFNECTLTWVTQEDSDGNEINGYRVKGPNGNAIFMPAAGSRQYTTLSAGTIGSYWSSTPSTNNTNAYILYFSSSSYTVKSSNCVRWVGRSIRPVSD